MPYYSYSYFKAVLSYVWRFFLKKGFPLLQGQWGLESYCMLGTGYELIPF